MTPDALRDALLRRGQPEPGLVADPSALLRALETEAEQHPADAELRRLIQEAHALLTCADGLPVVVGGVRRISLVRWDHSSVTFEGADLETGGMAMVRTLRAHATREPVLRRALSRDARALTSRHPWLRFTDGAWPAITLPLEGPPFSPERWAEGPERDGLVLARLLTSGLADLSRAETDGLGLPAPDAAELRDGPHGLRVACLTPWPTAETGAAVAALAAALAAREAPSEEGPLDGVLASIQHFHSPSAREAGATVAQALASWLAGRRHTLAARARRVRRAERHDRLMAALNRLAAALPPPLGLALVGVDLDGRTLLAEATPAAVRWGPQGTPPAPVWTADAGLQPSEARRLVRMAAAAPASARLLRQTGADPALSAALPRWLETQLRLHTVREAIAAHP